MDVDGGNTNSHTLTGLTNGQTYIISIVGTSSSTVLPSAPVSAGAVGLGNLCKPLYESPLVSFTIVQCEVRTLFHSSTGSSTQ